jgi:3-oxoadipate enol-lactonase
MQEQKSDIHGFSMAYTDRGEGRPVLFIHGYPLNRSLWQPQFEGVSGAARLIAPDLRGFGDSQAAPGLEPDPQTYSMDLFADDCLALLDDLGIDSRVVVCGLSMGGYITFALVRDHPERVAGLVLAATRAKADTPEAKSKRDEAIRLAREKGAGAIAESMRAKLLSPHTYANKPDVVDKAVKIMEQSSVAGIIGALNGMKARPDSRSLLPEIKAPVLLLQGQDDQIIPAEEIASMQKAIPHSKLVSIPEAGHLLNLEQPEMFNRTLLDFIHSLD